MSNDWAIEAHDTTGRRFLYRRITTRKKIGKLIAQIMTNETTGGIVIYRSTVAESNKPEKVTIHNDVPDDHPGYAATLEQVVVGAMDYWPAGDPDDDYDGTGWPSALSAYERGEHPCPPLGGCKTCGCPPENMPMVNRGTGWCSEAHRKEQLARSNKDD